MVILHYTGMIDARTALERLCDPVAKVSAHYTVDEDGAIYQHVAEEYRAWHAGVASWGEESDINGASIGIEMVNPGHEFGYRDFSAAQYHSVISLLDEIRGRWSIDDRFILGHSDVAPSRKSDPGERFLWAELAKAGHGLWALPDLSAAPHMGPALGEGDEGIGVFSLQAALGKLGYGLKAGGPFDAQTKDIVTAFQRHWLPEKIATEDEGRADAKTRLMLTSLLRVIES